MPRLGRAFPPAFRRLWLAAALSNLGDGAALAAGPLLLATVTTNPAAVAAATFAQLLPWPLFALTSGALADRLPRRTVIAAANATRAAVIGALAVTIAAGTPPLWLLYLVSFLMGAVETLTDAAYGALVADTVPTDLLGRANARLQVTFTLTNLFAGPPLGAVLFAAGAALPFGTHAIACAAAALVVARVPRPPHSPRPQTTVWADVGHGLRWLWRHPGLRILAACIFVMNLAGVGTFAIWVLYGTEHLGLTERQYGWFVATGAAGAVAGAWAYTRLEKTFGNATLLRAGIVIEALTYLSLTLTSNPWVAGAIMVVFSVHAMVWGAVTTTTLQRGTPSRLRGRAGSVYQLASFTGSTLGALLGGFVADRFGLLAPFWLAAALVAVMAALAWRQLATVDGQEARSQSM